jgi:hypothetical protein
MNKYMIIKKGILNIARKLKFIEPVWLTVSEPTLGILPVDGGTCGFRPMHNMITKKESNNCY